MLQICGAWKQYNTFIIVIVVIYFNPFIITVGLCLTICHLYRPQHPINDSAVPRHLAFSQLPLQDVMTQVTEQKDTFFFVTVNSRLRITIFLITSTNTQCLKKIKKWKIKEEFKSNPMQWCSCRVVIFIDWYNILLEMV